MNTEGHESPDSHNRRYPEYTQTHTYMFTCTHAHGHTWVKPQRSRTFHNQPPDRFIHSPLRHHQQLVKQPPRQILRHPLLSCTLTFASWMLRPFLSKVSFTPFIQLFFGLPLLLTPFTSESYYLLTNLSFPILSTCPKPSENTRIHSLTHAYIFATHPSNLHIWNPINPS